MTVVLLSIFVVFSILGKFIPKDERAIQTFEYQNETEAASGFIAQIFLYGLVLLLVGIIAKSDKVNLFFGGEPKQDLSIMSD